MLIVGIICLVLGAAAILFARSNRKLFPVLLENKDTGNLLADRYVELEVFGPLFAWPALFGCLTVPIGLVLLVVGLIL